MEFTQLTEVLTERYGRYLALIEQAWSAIGARDVEALASLDRDCHHLLLELRDEWSAFTGRLEQESELEPRALPALHRLKDLVERTRDHATMNEGALAQWLGETGSRLREIRRWKNALHGYGGDVTRRPGILRLNA